MDKPKIFSATLGLSAHWSITSIRFSGSDNRLDIDICYEGDTAVSCPECGGSAQVCTRVDETWFHSDFFRYTTYLHARIPLFACPDCPGQRRITVPWARPGTKFFKMETDLATGLAEEPTIA